MNIKNVACKNAPKSPLFRDISQMVDWLMPFDQMSYAK